MSCAQNGPAAFVGCCSSAPREPFLRSRGPTAVCCSSGMTEAETFKKSRLQWPWRYSDGMASHNLWHVLPAPIPNGRSVHLSALSAKGHPHPGGVRFFEHKRAIRSSSSSIVEVGSSGSGASRVVHKGES